MERRHGAVSHTDGVTGMTEAAVQDVYVLVQDDGSEVEHEADFLVEWLCDVAGMQQGEAMQMLKRARQGDFVHHRSANGLVFGLWYDPDSEW